MTNDSRMVNVGNYPQTPIVDVHIDQWNPASYHEFIIAMLHTVSGVLMPGNLGLIILRHFRSDAVDRRRHHVRTNQILNRFYQGRMPQGGQHPWSMKLAGPYRLQNFLTRFWIVVIDPTQTRLEGFLREIPIELAGLDQFVAFFLDRRGQAVL